MSRWLCSAMFLAALLGANFQRAAFADPPSRPLTSFDGDKKVARNAIYADHDEEFYCGCAFTSSLRGVLAD